MNKQDFKKKLSEAEKPVIIDFWAPWCSPCMMTKPILEKLAKEYSDRIEFMPVNADEAREVLEQYRILGIPTVLTVRNGKEIGRVTGAQNEAGYRAMFEAVAEGREIKVPLTSFDRSLRLGAGLLFVIIGINTGNWLVAGIGGIIAFMGFYDRCPIWQALTGLFKRN